MGHPPRTIGASTERLRRGSMPGRPRRRTRPVMHRSSTVAQVVGSILLLPILTSAGSIEDALKESSRRLERQDAKGAITILEDALTGATAPDRARLIARLREAYEDA